MRIVTANSDHVRLKGRTEGLATPLGFIGVGLFILAVFAIVLYEPITEGDLADVWMFLVALVLPIGMMAWAVASLFRFESLEVTPRSIVHRRWWSFARARAVERLVEPEQVERLLVRTRLESRRRSDTDLHTTTEVEVVEALLLVRDQEPLVLLRRDGAQAIDQARAIAQVVGRALDRPVTDAAADQVEVAHPDDASPDDASPDASGPDDRPRPALRDIAIPEPPQGVRTTVSRTDHRVVLRRSLRRFSPLPVLFAIPMLFIACIALVFLFGATGVITVDPPPDTPTRVGVVLVAGTIMLTMLLATAAMVVTMCLQTRTFEIDADRLHVRSDFPGHWILRRWNRPVLVPTRDVQSVRTNSKAERIEIRTPKGTRRVVLTGVEAEELVWISATIRALLRAGA